MSKFTAGLTAVALTGLMAIGSVIPAQAQILAPKGNSGDRDRVVQTFCQANPRDRDCRTYSRDRWDDRDYDRFYGRNRSGLDNIASGLFGFGFGAIVGGAIANQNNNNNNYNGNGYGGDRVVSGPGYGRSNHVQACYARYRSYDERTDTYLGFDGNRRLCNL